MAPKKEEEMKKGSKGDFFNFIKAASNDESLRKAITDVLRNKKVTAEKLQKFFHKHHYDGISLDDCGKIVAVAKGAPPWAPWDHDLSKY